MPRQNQRVPNPPLTPGEATAALESYGFTPLAPYPGGRGKAWPARCTVCGRERSVRLGQLESEPSRRCSHRAPFDPERPPALARELGWEPQEPYTSANTPWKLLHPACGNTVEVTYAVMVRTPHRHICLRCHPENTYVMDEAEALRIITVFGFAPAEPYPGAARRPWWLTCTTCGQARCHSVYNITRRPGATICKHNKNRHVLTAAEAGEIVGALGWSPLLPYPAHLKTPWPLFCRTCGRRYRVTMHTLMRTPHKHTCHPPRPRPADEDD